MTQVYLIRHGEIDNPMGIFYGGTLDLTLNTKGKQQMSNLGEFLQNQRVRSNAIYTSDLSRAKESGQILAKKFGINVIEDERLGDNRIPQFAGLNPEEKEAKFPGKDEFDPTLAGHESKEQVLERMRESFNDIINTSKGRTIFIIGHGDPIRLLLASLINPDEGKIPDLDTLPMIEKGFAWKVLVNQQRRLQEYESVNPTELNIRGERES